MAPEPCDGKLTAAPKKRGYVTFLAGGATTAPTRWWWPCFPMSPGAPPAPSLAGLHRREVEPIYPPENQVQFAMAYYVINYSKMRVFELISCFLFFFCWVTVRGLQQDGLLGRGYPGLQQRRPPLRHPDGRFYAVMDCFCEKSWSYSPQYAIGYCQQCPERVRWPPELGPPPSRYFNSGMFVFEPSRATSRSIIEALRIIPVTPFAEQDFMNIFFEKIYEPLPLDYNLILAMLWRHPDNFNFDEGSKPWRYTGKEVNMDREDVQMLVAEWWKIYNDESLDFTRRAALWSAPVTARPAAVPAAIELTGSIVPAAC
ncbi:unnamed protein product [Spirodela intermedia]|uniref:Hexosyltransferase n=1 Tax=Spirodela intermedia TaxID=51605 RepID=A0A7I8JPH2_SPIIN|nr:unnamed protein product [Spirodela intermedia]CAA6671453.1 unnamed protein product [Spirodela intermedia]